MKDFNYLFPKEKIESKFFFEQNGRKFWKPFLLNRETNKETALESLEATQMEDVEIKILDFLKFNEESTKKNQYKVECFGEIKEIGKEILNLNLLPTQNHLFTQIDSQIETWNLKLENKIPHFPEKFEYWASLEPAKWKSNKKKLKPMKRKRLKRCSRKNEVCRSHNFELNSFDFVFGKAKQYFKSKRVIKIAKMKKPSMDLHKLDLKNLINVIPLLQSFEPNRFLSVTGALNCSVSKPFSSKSNIKKSSPKALLENCDAHGDLVEADHRLLELESPMQQCTLQKSFFESKSQNENNFCLVFLKIIHRQ